jgi:hypothetical protein
MTNSSFTYPVRVAGYGCLAPSGINILGKPKTGAIPPIKLRPFIPDRKSIKLMTRSVQLGVSATTMAVSMVDHWNDVPPHRRGFFVGASPQMGDPDDLGPAISEATTNGQFSISDFGTKGIGLIHPLWLVRGLSNNVLGFASAFNDTQGVNMSYCNGAEGGFEALIEGVHALLENRADIVIAGGADCLLGGDILAGEPCSEGAAFVVLERSSTEKNIFSKSEMEPFSKNLGALGAATWPIAFVRKLIAKEEG